MIAVGINDARSHFSELINKVESGEEIVIEDSGKPVVKMVPFVKKQKKRVLGLEKGAIKISKDFDILPEEQLKEFYL
jgi:prevent-host-death family protein